MCPEPQLLSVYFDGELPSPWKEKMESHLSQCPQCRQSLEAYRLFSPALLEGDSQRGAVEAAQERVWRKLEANQQLAASQGLAGRQRQTVRARRSPLWGRSVSVPLPALAAAAAVLVIALLFWLYRPAGMTAVPGMPVVTGAELDTPGIIPVSDMDSVLRYLGSRDSGDMLILRLPENRNFTSSGEPAIINAADYSRSAPLRRKP